MAMTPQEKKAYQKEYYKEYTKKDKKKGRKKGSKKKTSSKSLLGQSTSGLSTEGKMQAALIREDFKKQMNDALSKAKTDEERNQIRLDYSRKALAAIEKLKSDPKNVAAKTSKTKSSGSSKSSKSSGSNKSSGSSKSTGNTTKTTTSTTNTASTANTANTTTDPAALESVKQINNTINQIYSKLKDLSPEQKAVVKTQISDLVDNLRKKLRGN